MTAWREWRNSPPVIQAVDDANRKSLEFLQWLRVTSEHLYEELKATVRLIANMRLKETMRWWMWIIIGLFLVLTIVLVVSPRTRHRKKQKTEEPPVPSFEESPFLMPTSVGEILFNYPEENLDEETLVSVIEQQEGMKKGLHIFLHEGIPTPHVNPTLIRERFDILNDRLKRQRLAPGNNILDEEVDPNGRTLVIYNYVENNLARKNIEFFFRHHNPEWADVLVVINGKTFNFTAPDYVMIWKRPNIGLEVCSHFRLWPYLLKGWNPMNVDFPRELKDKLYTFFMLLNASVRGPFYPSFWSGNMDTLTSWVDVFKGPLIQKKDIGLVGTSFNCMRGIPYLTHLQSFALMTHRAGLEMMYNDLVAREHVLQMVDRTICEPQIDHMQKIITVQIYEIGASQTFLSRNIGIVSILTAWQEVNVRDDEAVFQLCFDQDDPMLPNKYNGKNIHPLEMIFHKTNSADLRTDMELVEMFSIWYDQRVRHYPWTTSETLKTIPRHTKRSVYKDVGYPANVGESDFNIEDYVLVRHFS